MPDEDEVLDYLAYDEDWEEGMSMYYDYNLLDLLEKTSEVLPFADCSYYDIENNSEYLQILQNMIK